MPLKYSTIILLIVVKPQKKQDFCKFAILLFLILQK